MAINYDNICPPPPSPDVYVCGKYPRSGTGQQVLLAQFDTTNVTGTTGLVPVELSTAAAYTGCNTAEIVTVADSVVGSVTYNAGTYLGAYQHDVTIRLFVDSAKTDSFINALNGNKFIAVLQVGALTGTGTPNETGLKAYGVTNGLKLSALTSTTEYTDGVVYEFTLTSTKEAAVPVRCTVADLDVCTA